jgi:hypothetical protein
LRKTLLILAFAAILGAAPISDWFLGNTLASGVWSTQLSGGTITQSNGGVTLSAPSGSTHDTYANAVRISQTVANSDFAVITKISTIPPAQTNGWYEASIYAVQDATNNLRYYYSSDSTSTYHCVLQKTVAGTPTSIATSTRSGDTFPIWLELIRVSNTWTAKFSFNGSNWTTLGSGSVTETLASIAIDTDNYNSTAGSTLAYAPIFYFVCNSANDKCIPPVRPNRAIF